MTNLVVWSIPTIWQYLSLYLPIVYCMSLLGIYGAAIGYIDLFWNLFPIPEHLEYFIAQAENLNANCANQLSCTSLFKSNCH